VIGETVPVLVEQVAPADPGKRTDTPRDGQLRVTVDDLGHTIFLAPPRSGKAASFIGTVQG
jgi:hypothetical protein